MTTKGVYYHILLMVLVIASLMILTPLIVYGNDIAQLPNCPICGMDRHKFAHSRMLIRYEDGSLFGSCSLHCTALELAYHPGKVPVSIEVADYGTHELVDAERAVWVLGGDKMGVMTTQAKWAFANRGAAQNFVDHHGGQIVDFETAISKAYADMYKDTHMIREKRRKIGTLKN